MNSAIKALSKHLSKLGKGLFTHTVIVAVFVSGAFDVFDVVCKQHHMTALNTFLNSVENDDVDGMGKRSMC